MAFCIYCGTQLPEVAKFCLACGKAVAPLQTSDGRDGVETAQSDVRESNCSKCGLNPRSIYFSSELCIECFAEEGVTRLDGELSHDDRKALLEGGLPAARLDGLIQTSRATPKAIARRLAVEAKMGFNQSMLKQAESILATADPIARERLWPFAVSMETIQFWKHFLFSPEPSKQESDARANRYWSDLLSNRSYIAVHFIENAPVENKDRRFDLKREYSELYLWLEDELINLALTRLVLKKYDFNGSGVQFSLLIEGIGGDRLAKAIERARDFGSVISGVREKDLPDARKIAQSIQKARR